MDPSVALRVIDRVYDIVYTDAKGVRQPTRRGKVLCTDKDGFVVIECGGRYVLILKDRIEEMVEVEDDH